MSQTMIIFSVALLIVILLFIGGPGKTGKFIGSFVVKGIIGVLILYVLNVVGAEKGIHVPINEVTASISALLGIPGIVALIVIQTYII